MTVRLPLNWTQIRRPFHFQIPSAPGMGAIAWPSDIVELFGHSKRLLNFMATATLVQI
jgi:hypothetical protein